MKKIVYISGTRADYGLMRKTLQSIDNHPELELTIFATGMHLMDECGNTINDVIADGFTPIVVNAIHKNKERGSLAHFFGDFTQALLKEMITLQADCILILGDRAEALSGAVIGAYSGIPVAHIHGGDSSGHVDDAIRHAITQLATLHFPATNESANRIKSMGIDEKSVYVVGAPGLVGITQNLLTREELGSIVGLPPGKDYLLVVQHPVFRSQEEAGNQMRSTITAARSFGLDVVVGYPNADPGSDVMIDVIKEFEDDDKIHTYKSLPHKEFLSCMAYAKALVGNSSCGIIETASFHLPVVNIGEREKGRQRSGNVVDVSYDVNDIKSGIKKALSKSFTDKVKSIVNVYGDGKTDTRIVDLLVKHLGD